jgi:hypothetical protein
MNDGSALEVHVESLLRGAGLEPRRRETIVGARQADEFDVVVDMTSLGISGLWVIECKDGSSRVKKDVVLTLCSRVENAGADKGIMVSSSGYQSGCWDAVRNRNILLLTTRQFDDLVSDAIARARLRHARPRLDTLMHRLERMHVHGSRIPGSRYGFRYGFEEFYPTGPDSDRFSERLMALRVMFEKVTAVLAGDEIYQLPDLDYDDEDESPPDDWYPTVTVKDIRIFAKAVTGYLSDWEGWTDALIPPP